MRPRVGLLPALVLLPTLALAQGRPDEESLFGGPSDAGTPLSAPGTPQSAAGAQTPPMGAPPSLPGPPSTEQERLSAPTESNAFEAGRVKENPLQIGGQFYLRGYLQAVEHTPPSQQVMSLPTLVDGFLDARPTDRLRAMVLARMSYDPFLQTFAGNIAPGAPAPANPGVALDQAWLSFDIAHRVFVTAGRQHVRWGTGHFFSPTDILSSSRRDPLALIDTRLGVSMLRASVPWEAAGWTFTGVALFEPTQLSGGLGVAGASGSTGVAGTAVQTTSGGSGINTHVLGYVGGAARAEATFGNTVVGIDGLVQRGRKSRAGVDFTSPLGPLDIYGEGLLISGSDYPLVVRRPVPDFTLLSQGLGAVFYDTLPNDPGHLTPGVVLGGSYSFALEETRSITLAAEYFYNGSGYSSASVYPGLILTGNYQPFYNGKNYLAANASLTDTTAKTSYILSNVGNLSDGSYVIRFDFTVTAVSYLTVEAFADWHYGNRGGEFRFAFDPGEVGVLPPGAPALNLPVFQAPLFDVGFGLRLAL